MPPPVAQYLSSGSSMRIMKLAPAAAMALSGAALLILALAPLGTALGWWHFGFGLYWMMPWSGYVAATAAALAVATLALGWSKVRPGGHLVLATALVMGTVACAYIALAVSAYPLDPAAHSRHHHGYRYPAGVCRRSAGARRRERRQRRLRSCPAARIQRQAYPRSTHPSWPRCP